MVVCIWNDMGNSDRPILFNHIGKGQEAMSDLIETVLVFWLYVAGFFVGIVLPFMVIGDAILRAFGVIL